MKAKKENKVYRITTEIEKQRYLKEGYDIYSDEGELLEHSPLKKIAYSAYAKLLDENRLLKEENDLLAVSSTPADDEDVASVLMVYAKEHNIDIGKAVTVSGIMKKIKGYETEGGE